MTRNIVFFLVCTSKKNSNNENMEHCEKAEILAFSTLLVRFSLSDYEPTQYLYRPLAKKYKGREVLFILYSLYEELNRQRLFKQLYK